MLQKSVVWSDKTKINRLGSAGRVWGWKKAGEGLSDRLVKETAEFGGGSLMMWGYMCWGTYAYMHICTKSIQIYFSIFFDFILVLLSFHCSHTVLIFSEFFPIFLAILFTSKACHFDMALLILLLFKCPHSCASCGIKSYYMQRAHLGGLSGVEAGGRNRVYVG